MDYNYKKRGYLLPEGCKDLIDVLKSDKVLKPNVTYQQVPPQGTTPQSLPPIIGEMTVSKDMTVRELADALKQKPFRIIADLMELGVFANVNQPLAFDTVSQLVRKYGIKAKKVV